MLYFWVQSDILLCIFKLFFLHLNSMYCTNCSKLLPYERLNYDVYSICRKNIFWYKRRIYFYLIYLDQDYARENCINDICICILIYSLIVPKIIIGTWCKIFVKYPFGVHTQMTQNNCLIILCKLILFMFNTKRFCVPTIIIFVIDTLSISF